MGVAGSGSSPTAAAPFLLLDDQRALAREHEEPFLAALGVVERARLARPNDVHVDAEIAEPRISCLERIHGAALLVVAHRERIREVENDRDVRPA